MFAHISIVDVTPVVEGGRLAVKATVGEQISVRARVFAEKHLVLRAQVVLTGPDVTDHGIVAMRHIDNDVWGASVAADIVGPWSFHIEAWSDPYARWERDAAIKSAAGVAAGEIELVQREGELLRGRDGWPDLREHVTSSIALPVFVDRERALFSAWYEFFPRSEGGLAGSVGRLDAIAAMGFDVVYLPPIHPIGRVNRKGRDNALVATELDPGSPWAIGAVEGGHDAIHPELGTLADFDTLVARAGELGMEVALDFALQCAPDHPWVAEHPEWFSTRADGTIAFAENPPKRYEDIYPLDFDQDPEGLYAEVQRVVRHWMSHGVRIFRVDNPHTKPIGMWQRLLSDIRSTDPDVLFLAEAFTAPAMVHGLGAIGFHQSYTYITWREHRRELGDYLREVSGETSHVMRPNFWVNTPDILPRNLQAGDPAMFKVRAVIAATGSPAWGMYSGFELCEHEPAEPGSEEYLHSEKYETRDRDWTADSLAPYITQLNAVRRAHPALQQLCNLTIFETSDADVLCFHKWSGQDTVTVVVNVEPSTARQIALPAVGAMRDELTGETFSQAISLDSSNPARILIPLSRQ